MVIVVREGERIVSFANGEVRTASQGDASRATPPRSTATVESALRAAHRLGMWNLEVIQAVSRAYRRLADETQLRVRSRLRARPPLHRRPRPGIGGAAFRYRRRQGDPSGRGCDPWDLFGEPCPKPIVVLVSELVPPGRHVERAVELAHVVAANAPLAIRASLASARAAERAARDAARQVLVDSNPSIVSSADAAEGVAAFLERRPPVFRGV